MNKLTLLLQNREVIAEIAKDPEVLIRIKDAIIDGAIKRAAKLANGISDQIAKALKEEMIDSTGWRDQLKPEYKEIVRTETKNLISSFVNSEVTVLNDEVKRRVEYHRLLIMAKLEELDIDKVIREEIRKVVNEKFK